MKKIGLLLHKDNHHLDHLAPLCSLLNIPLATDSEIIFNNGKIFYPDLKIFIKKTHLLAPFIMDHFDSVISSISTPLLNIFFFPYQDIKAKKITYIWCPHGYSDKGQNSLFFEALNNEDVLLYYGSQMLKSFEKKIKNLDKNKLLLIGNYRKKYFDQHHLFYQQILSSKLCFSKKNNLTLLYAPTWNDSEDSSSVDLYLSYIIKTLPSEWNLMIKLHPNTLKKASSHLITLLNETQTKPNIICINTIPTILPLLSITDVFISDMSSIGYDFLSFKKPMFFLPNPLCKSALTSPLFQCGYIIKNDHYPYLFSTIKKNLKPNPKLEKEKQILYKKVFTPTDIDNIFKKAPLSYNVLKKDP